MKKGRRGWNLREGGKDRGETEREFEKLGPHKICVAFKTLGSHWFPEMPELWFTIFEHWINCGFPTFSGFLLYVWEIWIIFWCGKIPNILAFSNLSNCKRKIGHPVYVGIQRDINPSWALSITCSVPMKSSLREEREELSIVLAILENITMCSAFKSVGQVSISPPSLNCSAMYETPIFSSF